ncbi:Pax [Salix suchowensis]|nr:Pax [Salix suchowensis]
MLPRNLYNTFPSLPLSKITFSLFLSYQVSRRARANLGVMPVSGNEETGVKSLAQQSSLNIAGVPIKKRRFIWPPSPPLEEQSVPLVENDFAQKEPGSTSKESTPSNSSVAASSDLSNAVNNFVAEENKNSLDSSVQMNAENCSGVEVKAQNLATLSDSLAKFGKQEKPVVEEKSANTLLISAKTELNLESNKGSGLNAGKEICSQQILKGKCKSETPIVSVTSQSSLGLKERDVSSLECCSNDGRQNNENVGAVSLNLSLSEGETGVLQKRDNILATDSTDVFANRLNWDLNTIMDTWDGSSSDEHAAQVTADGWNSFGVKCDITTEIVGTGIVNERQLLDGIGCKSSFPQTFSVCAKEYRSEDSLHLRLRPSFPSFNSSHEHFSSSAANKESCIVPKISLAGSLLSAGNATMANSRSIKSEPFDGSPNMILEELNPEASKSSAFGSLKLVGHGVIKPEPFHDGKPETPGTVGGALIQPDKQVLQSQDTGEQSPCLSSKQVLEVQVSTGQPSCSTDNQVRESQDILAKPACSTDLSISGNASDCLEYTTSVEGALLRNTMPKETPESAGQVSSEMGSIPVGHTGKELEASVKIDSAVTKDRNGDALEQCELKFTEEVPAGSHGNVDCSVTDEEKINLSGDMIEEDSCGSGYESDCNTMSMDIDEERQEHEFEDGEVRDLHLQAAEECQKCEEKDVIRDNSEHEKANSGLAGDDHHISSLVEENDSKIELSENIEVIVKECITRTIEDADNASVKETSTVEMPTCGTVQERETTTIQRKSLDTSGKKDDQVGQGTELSSGQDTTAGQGVLVSAEQGSDENIKTNSMEKNELPEDEIYFDGPCRFSRDRHQENFPRNSRMNFARGRGRISSRIDTLRGDRDSERNYASEFYNGSSDFAVRRHKYASAVAEVDSESMNYNITPDGSFVGTARGGRRLLDDETPVFRNVPSRRRSPGGRDVPAPAARGIQMVHRVPRNIGEEGSEVIGARHAENMRGFPDDGTEQAFRRPQPSYEGLDGHFHQGTRNYSSVHRRAPPQFRSKSPIRSRSPGPWSSARRRSPDGFGGTSELSNRRSPIYSMGRIRSPDQPGFPREMVARRHGSPPFLSRPTDTREMDPGHDPGHSRSIISNRGQTGRFFLRNNRRFGITGPRERTNSDEFFGGPIHSGRFHDLGGDGNVEDRRRFSERRGPVRSFKPPFNGSGSENFHPEDGPRPFRFFAEDDPEFHERSDFREREFDGRIRNRPGNAPRRPRDIEEQEGNYRHGRQATYDCCSKYSEGFKTHVDCGCKHQGFGCKGGGAKPQLSVRCQDII